MQQRVDRAASRVIRGCAGRPLTVRVLSSANVCAYGWIDGEIYLTRGLVELLDDSEIAAAVAHEVGHLLNDGHVRSVASLRGCHSGMDEESSADLLGTQLLEDCGIGGEAMVEMLKKVARSDGLSSECRTALRERIAVLAQGRPTAAQRSSSR